jgi:DNA-binding GntR family transcriptional regulator
MSGRSTVSLSVFEDRRPRYQTVAEELSLAIRDGAYPVGSMLPAEGELCAKFGVSRQTVREATRLLLQIGLVSRHQGIGTRVERRNAAETYVQRLGALPDLWQYVKETRRKILRVADVPAHLARVDLPGDRAQLWRLLEGLRFAADEKKPIAWTQIHVPAPYAAVMDEAQRQDLIPVYSLVERTFGIKTLSVKQEIRAVALAGELATLLKVKGGSPGLAVHRQYISTQNDVFEVSVSIHPADRYHYSMQLDLSYAASGST